MSFNPVMSLNANDRTNKIADIVKIINAAKCRKDKQRNMIDLTNIVMQGLRQAQFLYQSNELKKSKTLLCDLARKIVFYNENDLLHFLKNIAIAKEAYNIKSRITDIFFGDVSAVHTQSRDQSLFGRLIRRII